MKIAVPKESAAGEQRVALVPSNVAQLVADSHEIQIEAGAGEAAGYSDIEYEEAGAASVVERTDLLSQADLIVQVRGLGANEDAGRADLEHLRAGQTVLGLQEPLWAPELTQEVAAKGVTVMALETIPRISRAQSMDVLSSMATLAGYKAVLLAAIRLPQMFPMMMTAAGTVRAARVFVLGAGVAGLQAIATARRLGAVVEGYDIRPAASEQIESLGAKAVQLPVESEGAEDAGGYATAQGEDFNRRQREFLTEVLADKDVVITTAAIPGRQSPLLLETSMVDGMKPGSVIVDLAAERGGNCELTQADQEVQHGGVLVLGPTDLPSSVSRHASQMFSNNVTTLLKHLCDEGSFQFDVSDEITRDVVVAKDGEILHPMMREKLGLPETTTKAETAEAAEA
ncbi:MAG: Re/Si-specific NAD(P)(+) transhydrogenase subunit alpha [Acidobacteriota bacterium]